MRFRIFPYNFASESATLLRNGLRALGFDALKIKRDGTYRYRLGDIIVNWGNSNDAPWMNNDALSNTLNRPENVAYASNKLNTFRRLEEHGVATLPYTTDRLVASRWRDTVYVRHVLNGHSGEGIEIYEPELVDGDVVERLENIRGDLEDMGYESLSASVAEELDDLRENAETDLPDAPLYTRKVVNNGEYRVHVFRGQVIDYRKKSRHRDDPAERDQMAIRTLGNGWIYRQSDLRRLDRVEDIAIRAINALGLDFGAVDIINDEANTVRVIEVNTAVGMDEATMNNYVNALNNYARGQ